MAGIIFYICLYFQLSFVQFLILLIVLLAEWSAIICLYLFTLSNYFVFLISEFFWLFCSGVAGKVLFIFLFLFCFYLFLFCFYLFLFVFICLYFQFSISEGILLITIKQVLLAECPARCRGGSWAETVPELQPTSISVKLITFQNIQSICIFYLYKVSKVFAFCICIKY